MRFSNKLQKDVQNEIDNLSRQNIPYINDETRAFPQFIIAKDNEYDYVFHRKLRIFKILLNESVDNESKLSSIIKKYEKIYDSMFFREIYYNCYKDLLQKYSVNILKQASLFINIFSKKHIPLKQEASSYIRLDGEKKMIGYMKSMENRIFIVFSINDQKIVDIKLTCPDQLGEIFIDEFYNRLIMKPIKLLDIEKTKGLVFSILCVSLNILLKQKYIFKNQWMRLSAAGLSLNKKNDDKKLVEYYKSLGFAFDKAHQIPKDYKNTQMISSGKNN
jgi:hypothetical protein